ncbi:hypothetical protein PQR71_42165 [Paraburkholderia fungorum]|uniref:hypothetical protein n=1 Tax=Paraburkholderia fungorum TaxID=134537 RepID=UPI0038BA5EEB
MKYIVVQLGEKESIFTFPRSINHDMMYECLENLRFGNERNWVREIRKNGEAIAAGFIDNGRCYGRSETLGLESRGEADTALLRGNGDSA